ncbi:MAG: preprotein translocase subunit SecG [Candidatus Cloacimonetes bacterium]|nr:preprotein translocase subunit SecG [Candidatus Cloacimonadota bacterium]
MLLYTVLLVVHILISVALVLVILSQTSKGGLDATLGGAAMNVFGGSGASAFLRRWTQYLGVAFLVSCLFLAFIVKNLKTSNKAEELQKRIKTEAPVSK